MRLPVWVHNLEHRQPLVRKSAAFYLGQMRAKPAIPTLIGALVEETEATVRTQIIKSLSDMGDPSILPQLKSFFQTESDPVVSKTCLLAIEHLEMINARNMGQLPAKKP